MKKTFRRALSLTIASGLTLAMAVTAGAAEGDTLTRGEMAKLLVEGAGLTDQVAQYQSQASVFSDVAEDSEYKGYINLAYAQGLISGTGADTFSPDAQTTQVEAAAAIMQYAGVPEEMLTSWPADYSTTAARVGLTTNLPSTRPTRTAPIGPSNGRSESMSDAEAPTIASTSGSFTPSAESSAHEIWTSSKNPSGKSGRMGRSIMRQVRISLVEGRPSRLM